MIEVNRLAHRLRWEQIDRSCLQRLIEIARLEDLAGAGLAEDSGLRPSAPADPSGQLLSRKTLTARAAVIAREPLVLCGLPLIEMILQAYGGSSVQCLPQAADGDHLEAGTCVAILEGPASTLLAAERILLNFLQHLSGVATRTSTFVAALGQSPTRLLDTRKTTPAYRALEKYAVATGGGWNHRYGLFDRIMLKDNHLAASGSSTRETLVALISQARAEFPHLPVQVEVDLMEQIPPVIEAGAHVILLDNFSNDQLAKAVSLCDGHLRTEASGGIDLARLPQIADLGLDFISTGSTVHQSTWRDLALDWL